MTTPHEQPSEVALQDAQQRILDALRDLQFGAVEIQVHDFRIVRITRTEKVRFEPPGTHARDTPRTK